MKRYAHSKKKHLNALCFIKRKKRPEDIAAEDRARLIEEWRKEHEITRLQPGWSHYGWQS